MDLKVTVHTSEVLEQLAQQEGVEGLLCQSALTMSMHIVQGDRFHTDMNDDDKALFLKIREARTLLGG